MPNFINSWTDIIPLHDCKKQNIFQNQMFILKSKIDDKSNLLSKQTKHIFIETHPIIYHT